MLPLCIVAILFYAEKPASEETVLAILFYSNPRSRIDFIYILNSI
ncbi:hypothetical protein HCEICBPK_02666 [[Clostridium] scindens]|nr:hypothetical protein HCEICBPK_02666 [[Clostridium] scindens]